MRRGFDQKPGFGILLTVLLVVSLTSSAYLEGQKEKTFEKRVQKDVLVDVSGSKTFQFITSELAFDGETVKGAPFSATVVTETRQTLADGNRIMRSTEGSIARDSEGRTRREQTLPAVGPWVSAGEGAKIVTIFDPVAGASYSLDPVNKTARKNPKVIRHLGGPPPGDEEREEETIIIEKKFEPGDDVAWVQEGPGPVPPPPPPPGHARVLQFIAENPEEMQYAKEDLGSKTLEGVLVEGSRTVSTIAAGQVGNELPIEIVNETWFSPDLQTLIRSRHFDPRFGETLYQLKGIDRSEPSPALFEIPVDYKVEESGPAMIKVRRMKKE